MIKTHSVSVQRSILLTAALLFLGSFSCINKAILLHKRWHFQFITYNNTGKQESYPNEDAEFLLFFKDSTVNFFTRAKFVYEDNIYHYELTENSIALKEYKGMKKIPGGPRPGPGDTPDEFARSFGIKLRESFIQVEKLELLGKYLKVTFKGGYMRFKREEP
jgi:hypothetical protein